MSRLNDLVGQRFGRLLVISQSTEQSKHKKWVCKCDCGNVKTIQGCNLVGGVTKSCGCLHIDSISNPNKYVFEQDFGKCFLSSGEFFIFDLDDYEKIKDVTWVKGTKGYIVGKTKGDRKSIRVHRIIMNCPKGMVVDHINHNKLDNRKSNLRICTVGQNNLNKCPYSNRSEKTGVSWYRNKWRVSITINKQDIYLGRYDKYEDAVQVRLDAEQKYFGEFAYTNNYSN